MRLKIKIQFNGFNGLRIALVILTLMFFARTTLAGDLTTDNYVNLEKDIIKELNQERIDKQLPILVYNSTLQRGAQLKFDDMVKYNYFAHISPQGIKPWFWFEKVHYNYKFAGENLAINFQTAKGVHQAWMKSKTHRDNILFDKYNEVAVVVGKRPDGSLLAVEFFGGREGIKTLLLSNPVNKSTKLTTNVNSVVGQQKIKTFVDYKFLLKSALITFFSDNILQEKLFDFNNMVLLLTTIICLLLIVNVWALEKEDEIMFTKKFFCINN